MFTCLVTSDRLRRERKLFLRSGQVPTVTTQPAVSALFIIFWGTQSRFEQIYWFHSFWLLLSRIILDLVASTIRLVSLDVIFIFGATEKLNLVAYELPVSTRPPSLVCFLMQMCILVLGLSLVLLKCRLKYMSSSNRFGKIWHALNAMVWVLTSCQCITHPDTTVIYFGCIWTSFSGKLFWLVTYTESRPPRKESSNYLDC